MQYFDKNGKEIKTGMKILMEDGSMAHPKERAKNLAQFTKMYYNKSGLCARINE